MTTVPELSSVIKDYKVYENAFLPKIVIIPLAQEKGFVYTASVKEGDIVKEGDVIASYTDVDNNTVNLHSPVPGTVLDFIPTITPYGKFEYAVRIKLNGQFSYLGKKLKERDLSLISSSLVIPELMDKGVVNTFSVDKTINLGREIKELQKKGNITLAIRMFDEDQFRFTDSLISKFFLNQIIEAVRVLDKAVNFSGIVFAVDKHYEGVKDLEKSGLDKAYVMTMNIKKYPNGYKREIIQSFNRCLRKSCDFKLTRNDLFVDSSTLYEVYKALINELPSMERVIQFTGNCIYSSSLLNVKLGTTIREVVNQIGGFEKNPSLVIVNGHQSGCSISDIDVPVTKYTKSVALVSAKKVTDSHVYDCVNCGNCRNICPVKISPDKIYTFGLQNMDVSNNFIKSAGLCMNCGLCNTVCPSRLPLSQMIRIVKEKNEQV